ncbi:MAG: radical SAM protein, partial [Candidatus Helarchaeota archaeon]
MMNLNPMFQCNLSVTEEQEVSPAFEVYLKGCNLRCKFCSTFNDWSMGVSVETVLNEFDWWRSNNFHLKSIIFVGGEPSLHLDFINWFIKKLDTSLPIWLVSNLMMDNAKLKEIIRQGWGVIGTIYFGNNKCAWEI